MVMAGPDSNVMGDGWKRSSRKTGTRRRMKVSVGKPEILLKLLLWFSHMNFRKSIITKFLLCKMVY